MPTTVTEKELELEFDDDWDAAGRTGPYLGSLNGDLASCGSACVWALKRN